MACKPLTSNKPYSTFGQNSSRISTPVAPMIPTDQHGIFSSGMLESFTTRRQCRAMQQSPAASTTITLPKDTSPSPRPDSSQTTPLTSNTPKMNEDKNKDCKLLKSENFQTPVEQSSSGTYPKPEAPVIPSEQYRYGKFSSGMFKSSTTRRQPRATRESPGSSVTTKQQPVAQSSSDTSPKPEVPVIPSEHHKYGKCSSGMFESSTIPKQPTQKPPGSSVTTKQQPVDQSSSDTSTKPRVPVIPSEQHKYGKYSSGMFERLHRARQQSSASSTTITQQPLEQSSSDTSTSDTSAVAPMIPAELHESGKSLTHRQCRAIQQSPAALTTTLSKDTSPRPENSQSQPITFNTPKMNEDKNKDCKFLKNKNLQTPLSQSSFDASTTQVAPMIPTDQHESGKSLSRKQHRAVQQSAATSTTTMSKDTGSRIDSAQNSPGTSPTNKTTTLSGDPNSRLDSSQISPRSALLQRQNKLPTTHIENSFRTSGQPAEVKTSDNQPTSTTRGYFSTSSVFGGLINRNERKSDTQTSVVNSNASSLHRGTGARPKTTQISPSPSQTLNSNLELTVYKNNNNSSSSVKGNESVNSNSLALVPKSGSDPNNLAIPTKEELLNAFGGGTGVTKSGHSDRANEDTVGSIFILKNKVIGQGPSSIVYEGKLESPNGMPVAVKRITCKNKYMAAKTRKEMDEIWKKLYREVELLRDVETWRHPNIVGYYLSQTALNELYIAFQLCQGDLEDYVNEEFKFWREHISPKEINQHMAEGVRFLHANSIVHRDLKPKNVFLVWQQGICRAVIGDFGMSKVTDKGMFSLSLSVGSIGYLAPEVWEEASKAVRRNNRERPKIENKSDIFPLGLLFFFTNTNGNHPYGDELLGGQLQIAAGRPPNFHHTRPEDFALEALLRQMFSRSAKRPTAEEVCAHPALWDNDVILQFFIDCSDEVEYIVKEGTSVDRIVPNNILPHGNWMRDLPDSLRQYLKRFKVHGKLLYQGREASTRFLLRAVRNCAVHFKDLPDDVKDDFQPNQAVFWMNKCPRLLTHLFNNIKAGSKLPDTIALPLDWLPMEINEPFKVVVLRKTSLEFNRISSRFLSEVQTGAYAHKVEYDSTKLKVIQIEKIQNKSLYQQYSVRKNQVDGEKREDMGTLPLVRQLWHGTTFDSIPNIMKHGFNRGYSGKNGTWYGEGVYFAMDASYAARGWITQCMPEENGEGHIFLADVITGQYCRGHYGMRYLPPMDPEEPTVLYDSAADDPDNPMEFVVFHDSQAYPTYHITFTSM